MIVVDTNVVSELTRRSPAPEVLTWLDAQQASDIATTAITAAELLYGVACLPDGRRKNELATAVAALLNEDFRGRILSFDLPAAERYGQIVADCKHIGRPIGGADAQIAAICQATQATLATRNTSDFEHAGIELINPWKAT